VPFRTSNRTIPPTGEIASFRKQRGAGVTEIADPGMPPMTLLCIPLSLLGIMWGFSLAQRMTSTQFGRVTNLLLIASGVGLVA
jgi:hypothetical protein